MSINYELDPIKIEQQSFKTIRSLTNLDGLSCAEQQVVMRIVHSAGLPELAANVRFSANATAAGCAALKANAKILCDAEMVKQGLTKRFLQQYPLCFLNDPQTSVLAKQRSETRSMAAVDLWQEHLEGAIVIIGNAPTALFRLLELLAKGAAKPALIIGMPVGFIGAAKSKDYLWQQAAELDLNCITLLGRQGGSAIAAATCNALLRVNQGELY